MASTEGAIPLVVEPNNKKRRKQVTCACLNCRRSKTACSDYRPCKRCVDHGCADQCVDAPRKRRKKSTEKKDNVTSVVVRKGRKPRQRARATVAAEANGAAKKAKAGKSSVDRKPAKFDEASLSSALLTDRCASPALGVYANKDFNQLLAQFAPQQQQQQAQAQAQMQQQQQFQLLPQQQQYQQFNAQNQLLGFECTPTPAPVHCAVMAQDPQLADLWTNIPSSPYDLTSPTSEPSSDWNPMSLEIDLSSFDLSPEALNTSSDASSLLCSSPLLPSSPPSDLQSDYDTAYVSGAPASSPPTSPMQAMSWMYSEPAQPLQTALQVQPQFLQQEQLQQQQPFIAQQFLGEQQPVQLQQQQQQPQQGMWQPQPVPTTTNNHCNFNQHHSDLSSQIDELRHQSAELEQMLQCVLQETRDAVARC